MSKITKLFKPSGGSSKGKKGGPSAQEALFRLRETEDMLTKKQEYLEKKIEQELATARKHGTKNKRGEDVATLPGSYLYFNPFYCIY